MKLLFDNNVPAFLGRLFEGHEVTSAAREGWHELSNGALLNAAEQAGYQMLITLDRGFSHQQNLVGRKIAVLILVPGSQRRGALEDVAWKALDTLATIPPGSIYVCTRDAE